MLHSLAPVPMDEFQTWRRWRGRLGGHKVKEGMKAIVVPGSQVVSKLAEAKGLDKIFREAGFEWRLQVVQCAWQ